MLFCTRMLLAALIIAHRIAVAWPGITVTIKRNIFTTFYFHKLFELAKLAKIKWSQKFVVLQYIIWISGQTYII